MAPWRPRLQTDLVPLHTLADLQAPPPKRLWQQLRTLRSSPPGNAASGHRRETFNAALEQAEQLLTAARTVGVATQPILTFYGVSQIGRAVAASSTILSNKEYRLRGHGLTDGPLDKDPAAFSGITVRGEETGSFPTVAAALEACPLRRDATVGKLWGLIPDGDRFEFDGIGEGRPLAISYDPAQVFASPEVIRCRIEQLPLSTLASKLPPAELHGLLTAPSTDPQRIEQQQRLLSGWFSQYPGLSDARLGYSSPLQSLPWSPIQPVHVTVNSHAVMQVPLVFEKEPGVDVEEIMERRAPTYHSMHRAYPDIDGCGHPADPFLLWWAVLYVLSRLARYEPRVWERLISVKQSAYAVAIEYLLGEAQVAIPELALTAIERASA